MFSSLKIENYKTVKFLSIDNLAKINLFFGRNNCGKTTLLEAIFLLSGLSNPELFRRCNSFRSFNHITDLSYFFHNLNVDNSIKIISTGDIGYYNRTSQIDYAKLEKKVIQSNSISNNQINNSGEFSMLSISGAVDGKKINSSFSLQFLKNGEKNEIKIPRNYQEKINCNYLAPSIAFETIPNMVRKIMEEKNEAIVISALKTFDSRIKDFVLVNNDVMVDVGFNKRIPINMLGDGVRKLFTLVLAIYNSLNGILIIDEIDNGLHFSSMKALWNVILKVSNQFNTQLFITTHNIDSLKGMKKVLDVEMDYRNEVSFYKVIHRPSDENEVLYYNSESFSTVIEQENEIR